MEEFTPFQSFQEQLRSSQPPEGGGTKGPRTDPSQPQGQPDPTAEQQRKDAYVGTQLQGAKVVHSYMAADGQWIDCIDPSTQPSMQGRGRPAAPPPFAATSGASPTPPPSGGGQASNVGIDRYGNRMECPPGLIPVRRVTKEQLQNFDTLDQYFQKAPGGGALPPTG